MHRFVCARAFLCVFLLAIPLAVRAGPPFLTDDPEPVEYGTWEIYLASQYTESKDGVAFAAPHMEINYGILPNFQLHVILPAEYVRPSGGPSHYGYGDTELGLKWKFYENEEAHFLAGILPLLEVPTGDKGKGLGKGEPQFFMPLWLQKSWGPWTTYGGGGYWINPGSGNRNYGFVGWEIQRDITKQFTLGAEIFHRTPAEVGGVSNTGFNVGSIVNLADNHHILFSAGRDISGPDRFSFYIAYLLTFGPGKEAGLVETH